MSLPEPESKADFPSLPSKDVKAEEIYLPHLGIPTANSYRRTISPGLYEFVLTANCYPTGKEQKRFLNALQPKEDCERSLLANQALTVFPVVQSNDRVNSVRISSNVLPAVGEGEDRVAVHAINWTETKKLMQIEVGSDNAKKTVWGRWNDLVSVERECDVNEKAAQNEDQALHKTDNKKDLIFCSVFDGHAGAAVVNLLENGAHTLLAFGLAASPGALDGDEESIVKVIKDVYITISEDISAGSRSIIDYPATSYPEAKIPTLPNITQLQVTGLEQPGSCMATPVIDLRARTVYTAALADVRVLAIWQNVNTAHHPNDPNAIIPVPDGSCSRVLGGLLVTRAVGDLHFNRAEIERQDSIKEGIHPMYPLNHPTIDPPYIGWEPAVSVYPLLTSTGKDDKNERLCTLIIASDGLFDQLSDAETAITLLAHQHAQKTDDPDVHFKTRATTHEEILAAFPLINLPINESDPRDKQTGRRYLLQDSNPATHLIRNAMSNGDENQLREMLSLKHGTRGFRDDTAVVVVEFDHDA